MNNFGDDTRRERQDRLKRLRVFDEQTHGDINNLREKMKKSAKRAKR